MRIEKQWKILEQMVASTYENLGFVVLEIEMVQPGVFRMQAIEKEIPREVLVTVLLHGVYKNAITKRKQEEPPAAGRRTA